MTVGANGSYDVVVIGAGHNGLAASCLLARGGRSVLVLERRDVVGGLCAGEEFHPGYRTTGLLHDTAAVRAHVAAALRLHEHGLDLVALPPVLAADAQDGGLLLWPDVDRTVEEIGRRSPRDAERYRAFSDLVGRVRGVVTALLDDVPPDLGALGSGGLWNLARQGLAFRRLGRRDMMDLVRIPPMCAADWLDEWFEDDALRALLAAPAVAGTWMGPRSPGSAANLLVSLCTAGRSVAGGPAGLVFSLERAARHAGVAVRTGAEVARIVVEKGRATGVELAGGEHVGAGAVLATCDPKTTFLRLLGPTDTSRRFAHAIETYRMRGTTASVSLALDRPLRFAVRPDAPIERARTGANLDALERAFDAVKYRQASATPWLDVAVPTVASPECAPEGHAVASILVHFAPYALEGGWTADARERLGDAVVAELDRVAPGAADAVVAREVLTPADIEARYGVTGGHIHHGEHALDQRLVRPARECASYRTPVAGLYIGGSGSHPGGGVTCGPGALAARVIAAS